MAAGIINGICRFVADNAYDGIGCTVWDGEVQRYDARGKTVGPQSSGGRADWPVIKFSMPTSGFERNHTFEDAYYDEGMIVCQIWHTTRQQAEHTMDMVETLLCNYANWVQIGKLIPSPYREDSHSVVQLLVKHWTSYQVEDTRTQRGELLYTCELYFKCIVHGSLPFGQGTIVADPASASLLNNLLAHYRMEETSGNALDATAASRHATAFNSPGSATGRAGNARTFAAASSRYFRRAETAFAFAGAQSFTLACWAMLDSLAADVSLIDRSNGGQGYGLEWKKDAPLLGFSFFILRDAVTVRALSPKIATTGAWYFLTAWYDAAAARVYMAVDNETPTSTAANVTPNLSPTEFCLGATNDGAGQHHSGRLDEVSVWNRVLTAEERSYLWNNGAGRAWPW